MGTAATIVAAGSLAQKPLHGGHTWVFLQYLLGFRQLGWDVLFLDRLEARSCVGAVRRPCPPEESRSMRYFVEVMERFGLDGAFALLDDRGQSVVGLSREQVLERVGRSAFLLNIMGFLADDEILGRAPRRVFHDIDPGFGQMWRDLGLADPFRGHDAYVTIGENIGRPDCAIPTCGIDWITTPQSVVLEQWPRSTDGGECFTSIGSWRGSYGPLESRGKT